MIDRIKMYAQDTMNQLEFNLSVIIEDIKRSGFAIGYNKYVQEYLVADTIKKRLEARDYIMDAVGYIADKSEYISALVLYNTEGIISILKDDPDIRYYIKLLEKNYSFERNDFVVPIFSNFMTKDDSVREKKYYFAYLVPIYYSGEDREHMGWIGTAVVICDVGKLNNLIEQLKISKNTIINLYDQNNNVIISNNSDSESDRNNSKNNDSKTNSNKELESGKYIYTTRIIEDIQCTIECKTPSNEVRDDISFFKDNLLLTAVIMVILLILIGAIINISITSPIVKIVNAIREIGEKNLKQRINLKLDGDIGFIAQNINIMLDKVEQMARRVFTTQDKLYQMELLKKQAELSALQNQINPHFLYNTLECMRSIGIAFNIDEIVEISTAMADIFRYSIKSDDVVDVKAEIEIIGKYFKIIKIRFLGRFNVKVDVDDEIMNCRIPKMILQPIVENAVYHGLEKKDGTGTLSIYGKIKNEEIVFIIEDDGVGIQPDELERLSDAIDEHSNEQNYVKDKRSIGLANINSRIKLIFGKDYGLKIESLPNVGTKVTVSFPATSLEGRRNTELEHLIN